MRIELSEEECWFVYSMINYYKGNLLSWYLNNQDDKEKVQQFIENIRIKLNDNTVIPSAEVKEVDIDIKKAIRSEIRK